VVKFQDGINIRKTINYILG